MTKVKYILEGEETIITKETILHSIFNSSTKIHVGDIIKTYEDPYIIKHFIIENITKE